MTDFRKVRDLNWPAGPHLNFDATQKAIDAMDFSYATPTVQANREDDEVSQPFDLEHVRFLIWESAALWLAGHVTLTAYSARSARSAELRELLRAAQAR